MANVVQAAGAIVWRKAGPTLEVLLIHRPNYNDWSWPKGKPRKTETLPAAAIREVKEETGVEVALGVPLPPVRYRLADGRRKVNWYWAAHLSVDSAMVEARPDVRPARAREIDQVRWVDAVTALKMLTRRTDREPLMALLDLYADDHLRTWAVLIARHGTAKKRAAWEGDELTRPLTKFGSKQAQRLIALFSAYGVRNVYTSPWARCTDTVAPFAEAAGLEVSEMELLTEDGALANPKKINRLIKESLFEQVGNTMICTHRPALPIVLDALRERAPYRVQDRFPQEDPYLRTGEVLVVHVGIRPGKKRPRIIAVEQHRARG